MKSSNRSYDASDVADGYALAYEQVADLAAMIGAVRHLCDKNIEYVGKVYDVPESVFQELKRVFNITEGLIQDSLEFSKAQEDSYKC
ncbi:hypothetical protein MMP61_02025 [Acinetobacter sp. NIPH 1958]|uniref:hypothetical protein n=1 Tax=unclassified Acinetobacter TaxID=196816 RepID=UPI0012F7E0F3|nr:MULTISPECIES: hypothetical protein [unclassified Acinetobacter]MCH7353829.1 hypothetical protein [Acinetobacter sp. NIPH 2023]MCH7354365.1 hypothetical protein [Acinetobacter sp. NIPH 1958]MCH7361158.1 hypothetical protein [Acinetobacter sp. NIPH 2024]